MAVGEKKSANFAPFASIIYGAGLAITFAGERLIGSGTTSTALTVAGLAAVVLAIVIQGLRAMGRPAHDRGPEKALVLIYLAGLAALIAYFMTSNVWFHLTGFTLQKTSPRMTAVLETLWPALMLQGTLPVIFIEMSLSGMMRAPIRDTKRIAAAMWSALGLGFALVFCFSFAFVATERDKKVDLSYFRVAKAGESTLKVAATLDKDVEVYLFFPPTNEVLVEVESYFGDLTAKSPHVKVEVLDHAVNPGRAKELGVSGNGIILIGRDKVREQIGMPLQLERARDQLKRLDKDVHKRLLGVTRPPRVAYLTQGHGEFGSEGIDDTDKRGTIRLLQRHLLDEGYEVRELGLAEGLGTEIPADASVLLVLGPKQDFLPEEADAIERYILRQGRVLVAANPEDSEATLDTLLKPNGIKFRPTLVTNDKAIWRRSRQIGDRVNAIAAKFSSHASVTTLSKYGSKAPVVFPGAGYLEKTSDTGEGLVNTSFTVHSDSRAWNDVDKNFEFDPGQEIRKTYELAAVSTRRDASAVLPEEEGRLVVFSDADTLTDAVIARVPGNQMLFVDAIRWLGGEEQISGAVNSEEDEPLVYTRKQDLVWFYGTVFLAPVMVLGLGFFVTRGRRKFRLRKKDAALKDAKAHDDSADDKEDSQ